MKVTLFLLALSAVVATVTSTTCTHGDPSSCGMKCTDPNQVVGCVDREVCTCVDAVPDTPCTDVSECDPTQHCGHGESVHCLDSICQCLHNH